MSSVFQIGGATVDLDATDAVPLRCLVYSRDGEPILELQRRGIAPPPDPDPWLGQPITWTYSGTLTFAGDIVSREPDYGGPFPIFTYLARGLHYRGDLVPITDDNTLTDTLRWNLTGEDPDFNGARAGRTVGQIITELLTQLAIAPLLSAQGIGGYTSLSPPTLPAATVTDLAALTWIPPAPITIQGEKLFTALGGFLGSWAPLHALYITPAGIIRFLNTRTFTDHTLTMGSDPIRAGLPRIDLSACFTRVVARGAPLVLPVEVNTANGLLAEDFGHDGYTNAQVKAAPPAAGAWTLKDYRTMGGALDAGTCTCPSTTQVTVTSSDPTAHWPANYWDQTASGAHGVVWPVASSLSGLLTQATAKRVVANTALVAGGTSTLTLESPLPSTAYNSYTLRGLQAGGSIVWRKYRITNAALGAAMQPHFSWPVPWRNATNIVATLTGSPIGSVVWGTAPYFESTVAFTQDPSGPSILFEKPLTVYSEGDETKLLSGVGYATPVLVRALLAIAQGSLQEVYPADVGGVPQYSGGGTAYGWNQTKTITLPGWRDPSNQAGMAAYVQQLHDSIADPVIEGRLTYLDLWTPGLTMGQAVTIAGADAPTGYEGVSLPVLECEVSWPQGTGEPFLTQLSLSNRRGQFSGESFLRPPIVGLPLGNPGGGGEMFDVGRGGSNGTGYR